MRHDKCPREMYYRSCNIVTAATGAIHKNQSNYYEKRISTDYNILFIDFTYLGRRRPFNQEFIDMYISLS